MIKKKKSSYQILKDRAESQIRELEQILKKERLETVKLLFVEIPKKYGQEQTNSNVNVFSDSWSHPSVPNISITWEMMHFVHSPYLETLKAIIDKIKKS